jgi:hypothetical protein
VTVPELTDLGGQVLSVYPALLARLPVMVGQSYISVQVRAGGGSKLIGNGIGRPAHQWDLDLQVYRDTADGHGLGGLCIGD